jgi:hypothetical protein
VPSLSRPLHYFNLPGSRIRPQGLHSSADFAGALARLKEGLALVPEDSRLLRMKGAVEKTIAGAEGTEAPRSGTSTGRESESRGSGTFHYLPQYDRLVGGHFHTVEKQFATFVGPMAGILVKKAAPRTTPLGRRAALKSQGIIKSQSTIRLHQDGELGAHRLSFIAREATL